MSNNHNEKVAETREQRNLEKKQKDRPEVSTSKGGRRRRIRIRLIPLWLRLIIIALLIVASASFGAMFGYSVIGDGEAKDVFEKSTWTYIRDLIEHE